MHAFNILFTPNEEHNIHHAVVSISYYEHSEGEGSSTKETYGDMSTFSL